MIFVDTWAWIGMADDTDQYHAAVIKQHRKLLKKNRRYVTTDYVVGELIDYLYDATFDQLLKPASFLLTLVRTAGAVIIRRVVAQLTVPLFVSTAEVNSCPPPSQE